MSEADNLSKFHYPNPNKIVTTQTLKTPNSSISFLLPSMRKMRGFKLGKRLCRVTRWFFLRKSTTQKRIPSALPAFISAMQVQVASREATHLRLSVVSQGIVGYLWLQLNQLQL